MTTSAMTPTFALTPLVNAPSASIPTGFNAGTALIMAQCCALTYTQLSQQPGSPSTSLTTAQLAALNVASGPYETNYTFTQLSYQPAVIPFTGSESLGMGFTASQPGAFVTLPFGFAIQAADSKGNALFNIIALRGTKTYAEWVTDVDIVPTSFALNTQADNPGDVPGGFYSIYVQGTDGVAPSSNTPRPPGSLAQQLASLLQSSGWNSSIPLYFTGHSLGAALAAFAAMDASSNFSKSYSELYMYNFAPPNISAAGLLFTNENQFAENFQTNVPNSYSVVNAADIVPILPPDSVPLGDGVSLAFMQAVSSTNILTYCAQLQDIGDNHSLTNNYLPFVSQLANPS
jgi:Lipase (class 3)